MDIPSPSPRTDRDASVPSSEWALLLLAGTALLACTTVVTVPSLPAPAAEAPLPECAVPTNCVRASRTYAVPAPTLYDATQAALATLGPTTLRARPDSLRAAAVYRVGGVFKDDVAVAVTPHDGTSTLHVRSASRIGLYDFEVNRRRVQNLLEAVDRELDSSAEP